jgi:hypothetical protein
MANGDTLKRVRDADEENVILEQAKRVERGFVATFREEVAANGGTSNLNITNPSDSGVIAYVDAMSVRSQFEGVVDVYDEFSTAPSGGSSGLIDNLLLDSDGGPADTGNMTVRSNVSFTSSGTHVIDILPSGGPGGKIGGQTTATEPIIEPGREIVIQATNQSGAADDVAFFVVYLEEAV